ncbi:MAG TPA: hypothetical protein VF516_28150 [Kofleriaceae bacterium]
MTLTPGDIQVLARHPRTRSLRPLVAGDIEPVLQALPAHVPDPIRWWITEFGVIDIERPIDSRPHLLLLGLSPSSTIDDDIMAFNRSNPTLPPGYLVFAHEFDGELDHVYAIDASGAVVRSIGFLFPSLEYKEEYATSTWEAASTDLEAFWRSKVRSYLED